MLVNDESKEVSPGLVPETHVFPVASWVGLAWNLPGPLKMSKSLVVVEPEPVRQPKLHPGKLPKKGGFGRLFSFAKWMTFKGSMSIFRGASHFFFCGRKFQNVYKVGRRLGDGSFGSVSVFPGWPVVGGLFFFFNSGAAICSWKRGGLGWKMCWFLLGPPFGGFFRGFYSGGQFCLHFRVTSLKFFSAKIRKEPTCLEKKNTHHFQEIPPKGVYNWTKTTGNSAGAPFGMVSESEAWMCCA